MKAKPIFYQNGNDRRFEDQHTISVMTGEPMPRKWQALFDMTPEEKARWDASLKLDEEYRIAEAQGFPNGIPGGRTRGDMLYYLTQQEEAYNRNMQGKSFLGQSFIPQKTEIQTNDIVVPNNTLIYGQGNAQPSFTFNQKLNTDSPYIRQNNLLQMNTGIKKELAFDLKQAIRKIASQLEARTDDNEEQAKMSSSLMQSGQDGNVMNETVNNGMGSSLAQTFNQKYGNQFRFDLTKEDKLKQWEKNLEKDDYVILGDEYDDGIVMSRKEFMARYGKEQSELHNPEWDSDYGRSSVDTMQNSISEKEYIYPIQRFYTDMKKAPYANVQKMLFVNEENERYNTNTFGENGIDDTVYDWDYGDASDNDEMRYQQYEDSSLLRGWASNYQNFNNGYPEDSDSRYMFTTNGADAYMQYYGPAFVEDISAIMKEWGSAYNDWVAGLKQEDQAALGLLSGIVLDVAEIFVARIPFFPLRIAGIAVLMSITIYRAAKEVEADWKRKVEETMRKENCSEKEAEKMLKPVLIGLVANKIMEKVREEWVKKYLDDDGMPKLARAVITQDWTAALESIAEKDSVKPSKDSIMPIYDF